MGTRLLDRLDITLGELVQWDLGAGVLGAVGGGLLAGYYPVAVRSVLPLAAGVAGVMIGAVIGGVAIVAAFMDGPFLRKVEAIGVKPTRYVTPFVFTAMPMLGVISVIVLLSYAVTPGSAPSGVNIAFGIISGLFTIWTLASVFPLLSMLMDFVLLKSGAAQVPDEAVSITPNVKNFPQSRP